jgi:hypothetical protein
MKYGYVVKVQINRYTLFVNAFYRMGVRSEARIFKRRESAERYAFRMVAKSDGRLIGCVTVMRRKVA